MMITMTTIIMMATMVSFLGVYNGFFFFFLPKEINDHSVVFSIKNGECYPILVTL